MNSAPLSIELSQLTHDPSTHVIGVRFEKLGKLYHFDYTGFADVQPQDHVVVDTSRGERIGQIIGFAKRDDGQRDYKPILRPANGRDLLLREQWRQQEVARLVECRELAAQMGGYDGVKFIAAEYNYLGTHLTVMYSTEDDVDVSPLRAEYARRVPSEVEFRRIGPREVARRLGGQGACGIPRCCSTFLTDFSPISIKMAKAQGIPLNPNEITGMCGRLRCCLLYEYEQYVEARRQLPKRNKLIGTPHGEARVADVHPLKDGVSVYIEKQRYFVPREEIIPLDEFRALQAKAAAGCSKNESGGCDCGAHRPKSATGDLQTALDMAQGEFGLDEDALAEEEAYNFDTGIDEAIAPPPPTDPKTPAERNRKRNSRNRRNRSLTSPRRENDPSAQPKATTSDQPVEGGAGQAGADVDTPPHRTSHKRHGRFKPNQRKQ
jgi:cell fate regulator YaaT (PSP1 superfamily)